MKVKITLKKLVVTRKYPASDKELKTVVAERLEIKEEK